MTWAETGTIVASILAVGALIAGRFTDIHKRIDTLENGLNKRIDDIGARLDRLDARLDRLEARMDRFFELLQTALERVRT